MCFTNFQTESSRLSDFTVVAGYKSLLPATNDSPAQLKIQWYLAS